MTLDTLIILSGVFVATLPFLGFPSNWDTALLFIAGTLIIIFGIMVRRERSTSDQVSRRRNTGTFVEDEPQ